MPPMSPEEIQMLIIVDFAIVVCILTAVVGSVRVAGLVRTLWRGWTRRTNGL